jgi:hypothetical protein
MADTADYHRTRILALQTQLEALDGRVNQSDLGRSFDFDGAVDRIMRQMDFHRKQIAFAEGPIDDSVQGYA